VNGATTSVLPLLAGAILIGAVWCLSSLLDAALARWHRLARRHRARQKRPALSWTGINGGVAGARYTFCLDIGAQRAGVWIGAPFGLPLFHPPLLLPWSALRIEPPRKRLWSLSLVLVVVDEDITIRISDGRAAKGLWNAARMWAPESCAPADEAAIAA
jgi:hypothetical protein